jgi:peptidyl-prolyl cis-trans isomerase C
MGHACVLVLHRVFGDFRVRCTGRLFKVGELSTTTGFLQGMRLGQKAQAGLSGRERHFFTVPGIFLKIEFGDVMMASAKTRHILVDTEEENRKLKAEILEGGDFAKVAKQHSNCPSGRNGGDLGEFGPGQMVREFDEVVFNETVNTVHEPIKTQFGYHLIEVTNRSD